MKHSSEELNEEQRQDRMYKSSEAKNLYIESQHWTKFEQIEFPTHCYVYAVKRLGNIIGKRILDIGCGDGWFSVILAKRGAIVEGMDISTAAIEIAKTRAKVNDVENVTNFRKMSAYDLDYPGNHFDMIVGLSFLHHIAEKQRIAEPLYRILKPKGKIIFNEPFGNSKFLERLRLLIPVPVNEEDKTHWNNQIKYADLKVFEKNFGVAYKEFQFFSRLDRVFKSKWIIDKLGRIDLCLLEKFKFLRPYARDIVIELTSKKNY